MGSMATTPPEILFGHLPERILTEDYIHIPGLDAPIPREPEEWEHWARLMLVQRERIHAQCERDPAAQRLQRALCKQPHGLGVAYFLIMFGWIYEPREEDDMTTMPFLLYPRQAELLFAIDGVMQKPKGWDSSMAIPKARGVGATWLLAGDDVHRWLFKKNFQGRLVSRIEDMVDKPGSSDSWMYKHDYLIDRLPRWMVPEGYNTRRGSGNRYRTHMTMINPETGSAIIGEATTSGVGVGGRATRYSIDEAARFKDLRQVWGQLGETTNHRIAISTHNIEVNTDFWDMCHGSNGWPETVVFEMDWRTVISRDEAWLESTRETLPDDLFQREVMMNPWAGVSTWVYPRAKQISPAFHVHRREYGPTLHGLDDGYDDDFAIVWAQQERSTGKLIVLDGYAGSHQPISYYGHLLKGELPGRYDWDYEALRLAQWINDNRTYTGLFVGDRHGDNTDLTSGESPWQVLQRQFGLHVLTNPPQYNTFRDRRNALSEILDNVEFADTPGALAVLDALQNHRFPEVSRSRQPTQEIRRPIHDWTSHYVTALEYLAVYLVSRGMSSIAGIRAHKPVHSDWLRPKKHWAAGRRRSPDHYREVARW